MLKKVIIIFSVFLIATSSYALDLRNCTGCHSVENIGPNHRMGCIECHVLPNDRKHPITSHREIIKNPSALKYAPVLCGRCHKADIRKLKVSLHGTLAGAIAITRYIWGAQKDLKAKYGVTGSGSLKPLPIMNNAKTPEGLVNDFLRRKCLRCHLFNNGTDMGIGALGTFRAKGCAACHMKFNWYGTYTGKDSTVRGKSVFSATHRFIQKPTMRNCLSCHNTEFVGTDYLGWFPHDYPYSFNSPILPNGRFPPEYYGIEFHHLVSDIHYRDGMTCIDCHRKTGVMGDGKSYSSEEEKGAVKVTCADCHGGFSHPPSRAWVVIKNKKLYFTSRGKTWNVPRFNPHIIPHKHYHSEVACSACHSAWQNENYGLNVFLDKKPDYLSWKNLTSQEDPYLKAFLTNAIKEIERGKTPPLAMMPDRITEVLYPGIWFSGWTMRRWSYFTLGKTNYGIFKILRPLFEYFLSYRNNKGQIILNNVTKTTSGRIMSGFLPYDPHTITLHGKSCEACHNNPMLTPHKINYTSVMHLLWGPVLYGYPLPKKTLTKFHSMKYKFTRFHLLEQR